MLLPFRMFIKEGGNVRIGEHEADPINLSKVDRDVVVKSVWKLLDTLNRKFKQSNGVPLWSSELFASKEFLSGSAFHFFDTDYLSSKEFKQYKNIVGDIDTQVDKAQETHLKKFLTSITNKPISTATLIGFKGSLGQFITLWHFSDLSLNIQIDFELVDFLNGHPTEWSHFSHSSAWEDIKQGIKGVFQKYLMRAFTSSTLREVIILKGKKQTPTKTKTTDLAFSTKGIREKLEPVIENGQHQKIDGLYVYREIPTSESTYITDLESIFSIIFLKAPTGDDINNLKSFVGGINLAKKYLKNQDLTKIIEGFAFTLWGQGAQGLYRNDVERDQAEKLTAFKKMIDVFKVPYNKQEIDKLRVNYYTGKN